jgi:hypothetical protein
MMKVINVEIKGTNLKDILDRAMGVRADDLLSDSYSDLLMI